MGRPDFGRPTTPPIPHHLHDDGDAVDRDAVEGLQHGLPYVFEPEPEPTELKPTDSLGLRWRVPLSWVHNPYGVFTLYLDQLDAQTHD